MQIITRNVKSNTNLIHKLCEICKSHIPREMDRDLSSLVSDFMKTFVRKYTHARIQGFIKGEAERKTEKNGSRFKGGSNLRDKLYSMSNL